jgi:putative redox protein
MNKRHELKIDNPKGHSLQAYLDLPPDSKPRAFALFAHCFTCNSNFNAVRNISRALTQSGFGVVRFDFTGLGNSEGPFAESHFSANVEDLKTVYDYIGSRWEAPALLIGHSLGGAAALVAAKDLPEVKAVATIGAPASVKHVKQHFIHQVEGKLEEPTEVSIGGRPFVIDQQFIDEFSHIDLLKEVGKMKKPLLILHGPFDKTVDISNARDLYVAALHPKSFVSLDQADHLLSQIEDSLYAGKVIGTWAEKYLPPKEEIQLDPKGEQVVGHLNLVEDAFTTTIMTNHHRLIADEPLSVGGENLGPSPYELLNASLAACTAMTLKMYAARKKWPLEEVYVYLSHSRRHLDDVKANELLKLDHITKKLELVGDELTKEQRARLVEISSRCPVHRTLLGGVDITTELIDK